MLIALCQLLLILLFVFFFVCFFVLLLLEYYFNQASSKGNTHSVHYGHGNQSSLMMWETDSWNGIAGAPLILSPRGMQH